MSTKRCCIFAHYDVDDLVDPYVYEYIYSLMPFVSSIVFVSTSQLKNDDIKKLEKVCVKVVSRDNYGYDFYSWKTAIELIDLNNFDEILQVNDSCYAPIFSFDKMFDVMEQRECDFWGVTSSYRFSRHLQSYFVCYKKSVIQNKAFQDFWESLQPLDNKKDIVKVHEVGLSRTLLKEGFSMASYFRVSSKIYLSRLPRNICRKLVTLRNFNPYKYIRSLILSNPTTYYYQDMLEKQVPLIKVNLIKNDPPLVAPYNLYSVNSINTKTVDLILNHQLRLGHKTAANSWAPQRSLD